MPPGDHVTEGPDARINSLTMYDILTPDLRQAVTEWEEGRISQAELLSHFNIDMEVEHKAIQREALNAPEQATDIPPDAAPAAQPQAPGADGGAYANGQVGEIRSGASITLPLEAYNQAIFPIGSYGQAAGGSRHGVTGVSGERVPIHTVGHRPSTQLGLERSRVSGNEVDHDREERPPPPPPDEPVRLSDETVTRARRFDHIPFAGGFVTACSERHGRHDTIAVAFAFCAPGERFVKSRGRAVAEQRFDEGRCIVIARRGEGRRNTRWHSIFEFLTDVRENGESRSILSITGSAYPGGEQWFRDHCPEWLRRWISKEMVVHELRRLADKLEGPVRPDWAAVFPNIMAQMIINKLPL